MLCSTRHRLFRFCCCLLLLVSLLQVAAPAEAIVCADCVFELVDRNQGDHSVDDVASQFTDLEEEYGLILAYPLMPLFPVCQVMAKQLPIPLQPPHNPPFTPPE